MSKKVKKAENETVVEQETEAQTQVEDSLCDDAPKGDEQRIDEDQVVSSESVDEAQASADVVETFDESVEEMEEKITALEDQLLRTRADMENIRRRAERDVTNAHKYGLEKIINALLPVMDSLEKAQDHAANHPDAQEIHEGVVLTIKMFLDVLQKFDVEQIDPINDRFDPQAHEAMSMVAQEDVDSETVVNVLQKGYKLNGRLIRPARVFVSK
ncbi:MAG: nucleotide exchange factor GrpE [Pseudomonadota bacterium]